MERDRRTEDQAADSSTEETAQPRGRTPSTAPNASWETGAGSGSVGFDSPSDESRWLSNADVEGAPNSEPYYPPGGGADNEPSLHDERNT